VWKYGLFPFGHHGKPPGRAVVITIDKMRKYGEMTPVAGIELVPSGKRLHNYGKSPFSMGKSTINGDFQ
jgi:hypothetical protein